MYLNLLKLPTPNEENPEELAHEFSFRENGQSADDQKFWYRVGRILDFKDAEDAKPDVEEELSSLSTETRKNANKLIGKLHNRIHTIGRRSGGIMHC